MGSERNTYLQRGLGILLAAVAIVGGGLAALWVASLLFADPSREDEAALPEVVAPKAQAAAVPSPPKEATPAVAPGRKLRSEPRLAKDPPRRGPPLNSAYGWPREPVAPASVDAARFREAFERLCGPHADDEAANWYPNWIMQYAEEFGSDPFLLGAVVSHQSGCRSSKERWTDGLGLAGLRPELYGPDIREGVYRYERFEDGRSQPAQLTFTRFPFEARFLQASESNVYFAAAFLRVWREQRRSSAARFAQKAEYRHYVSHYIWGDVVRSNRQEDWILVERRRLLEYYGASGPRGPVLWRGFELGCPLDGCPRVITSTLGDARAGGKRSHRGVDFESKRGEPVLAIGAGKVVFAGVDLPGKASHQRLPMYAQRSVGKSLMGAGGLYVCIRHDSPSGGGNLTSCYMHLEALEVAQGRRVKRGTPIGRVGRTGIKTSPPHLHFEIHAEDGIHAADEALPGLAMGTPPIDIVPEQPAGFAPEPEP